MTLPPVLLTGFEPFGGDSVNASWEAVAALDGAVIAGSTVVAVRLPVVFGQAFERFAEAVARLRPRLAIMVGEAPRRAVSVERVALNLDDARMPDNAGFCPVDRAIDPEGPAALFSSLPVKAIVAAIAAAGIPARLSNSAGTYVCNHLFYRALAAATGTLAAGFVHVPPTPAQAAAPDRPSLPTRNVVEALRIAIATSLAALPSPAALSPSLAPTA